MLGSADNPADVILLHIGTNGLPANADGVESILEEIDLYSENITVVLARIIKRVGDSGTTHTFNEAVEDMAGLRIADGDKIRNGRYGGRGRHRLYNR